MPGTPSQGHVHTSLLAIRVWLHYLQQTGAIKTNPMSAIRIGSVKHEPRDILTLAEIRELYGVCKNLRERALLSLFYGCGLRRSEVEKLNIRDIHFKSGLLYVREGKGRKRRVIPMSATVNQELRDYYMHERRQYIKHTTPDNQQAFILNNGGERMRGENMRDQIRKIVQRTRIPKRLTVHGLRHSIATHLIESGMSLEYVRDFLGHEFIDTTQVYTRITAQQLQSI
jgi:integrase/recombinase XerD